MAARAARGVGAAAPAAARLGRRAQGRARGRRAALRRVRQAHVPRNPTTRPGRQGHPSYTCPAPRFPPLPFVWSLIAAGAGTAAGRSGGGV